MTTGRQEGGAQPGGRSRLGPFRHPAYTIYWVGGLVSNMGTWLQAVAGSIFVYVLTGSAFAVGVFNFAGFIPILLFSVWGGQLSDRFDRRRVVMWTHVASMVASAVLAALTLAGTATEIHVVVVAFVINTLWAVGKPSLVALIPNIVPRDDLQDAVGLNSLQFITGQIIGPTIAAVAMATSGAGLAFTINALTYLGPIVSMLYLFRAGLGGRESAEDDRRRRAARISAGTYLREHAWAVGLLVGIVATAAAMEIQRTLAPALVHEQLGESESTAGLLVTAQSIGSALALFLFVTLRRRGWSRSAAVAGYAFQGVGVLTVAVAPSLAVAGIGVGCIGFGFSLSFPVLTATLQEATPDDLRGRVMAVHQMAHLGNRPFTALFVGTIAGLLGVRAGALAGLVLVPVGLVAVRSAWAALARESAAGGRSSAPIGLEADAERDPERDAVREAAGGGGIPIEAGE